MTYMDPMVFFGNCIEHPSRAQQFFLHAARERSLDVLVFGGEVQLSNEPKSLGCSWDIGDYTKQLCGDYLIKAPC